MEFGVVLQADPPASRVIELAVRAEQNGFGYGWTFDSHVLWQEPFVILSRMLAETEEMIVGPMVTNPGTRDWTVIASLFATLNEMSGGRTVCGMGRGDSALRYIGLKPMTLATMEAAMDAIKALVRGDEIDLNGQALSIPWIEERWDLPIWGAGYGPRSLALIGQKCDGFILQLADPYLVEWACKFVKNTAVEAGRSPNDVKVCVAAPAYVGNDIAHQRDQVRWFGGMVGNHVADLVEHYGEDTSMVPAALSEYIKNREEYNYDHHGKAGNPSTDYVPDEIIDRFCILGPIELHISRMEELRDIGVDQFSIYLMHDQQEQTLDAYGASAIPALR